MQPIQVHVAIYGSLARRFGHMAVTEMNLTLESGATKASLLAFLGIAPEERGYLFINAVLHEVPGMFTGDSTPIEDGAHVGIFSVDYMWPYQYRDGVRMSDRLKAELAERGAMHHEYSPKTA